MEIIKSDTHLPQEPYNASAGYRKDEPKQLNLFYQQYALHALPISDATDDAIYELHSGLVDKNWEIRERALTKLLQTIPDLDLNVEANVTRDIIRLVTLNLGHMVSSVRKHALEVILAFVKYSKDPESVTRDVIAYGVDMVTADTNLSLNTIQALPVVLKYVKCVRTHLSHQLLAQVVTSLSKRMVQITHQRQVVSSLLRIKCLIGDSMFDHFLETYYPQIKRDFDVLCNVYDNEYSDLSDFSDVEASTDEIQHEPTNGEEEEEEREEEEEEEEEEEDANSEDEVIMKVYDEDGNEIKRTSSRRVTFGGEIVKIRTPDSEGTVITNGSCKKDEIDINADIVIQLSSDESVEIGNEEEDTTELACVREEEEEEAADSRAPKIRASLIPIPIRPALNKPKHPKHPFPTFKQPTSDLLNGVKTKDDQDLLTEMANYDGESLTSSSDSSDRSRVRMSNSFVVSNGQQKAMMLKNNTLQDLARMKINDKLVLENLFRKDDWRFYICGAERLTQILRQPISIQNISSNTEPTTGISLLCYVFNVLAETKNNRVINSSLRVLRYLCQAMQLSTLGLYLDTIIPKFCSYLGCAYECTIRMEAVELVKMLMRKFSPQRIVDILLSEHCFYSRSSKMRENSLLCLMYALITFPSTEFNMNEITELLIKHGISEQKRRVRQALLDTLSILGQLVPKSKLKIDPTNEEAVAFKRALRARLTRRQLPTVSQNGLIFYAFQISPTTAFGTDIEWILAGKGSLSDNYNKTKKQHNYVYGDNMSPVNTETKWNTEENTKSKTSARRMHRKPQQHTNVPNFIQHGSSEEVLSIYDKFPLARKNIINGERFSAGWTDMKLSSSLFEPLHTRYPSNLSDTSSYESSYTSDHNFPRLYPAYESNIMPLDRPVSEDKLNRLPWSSNFSKRTLKMHTMNHHIPTFYGYDSSASLPVLNDKKDRSFKHVYATTEKVNCYSSDESRRRWSREQENQENKYEIEIKKTEQIERESHTTYENHPENQPQGNKSNQHQNNENDGDDQQSEKLGSSDGDDNKIPASLSSNISQPLGISDSKTKSLNESSNRKAFLEKKAGVRLKRSLTKEIKIPQSTFNIDPAELPPFEYPKDGLQKTLLQFESREWRKRGDFFYKWVQKLVKIRLPQVNHEAYKRETVIEALQGVIRLTRHHSKQLAACLHPYVIAVSKEVRSLRSQVARAACLAAESMFIHMERISDQDVEELSHALFLRTADTNKFLREDSNKALDAMIDNIKFSKCILLIAQKVANHSNAMIRASAARLLCRLIQNHGPSRILSLTKEKKELVVNTVVKFVMDGNLQTRMHGKQTFSILLKDRKMNSVLTEMIPTGVLSTIHRSLSRINSSN